MDTINQMIAYLEEQKASAYEIGITVVMAGAWITFIAAMFVIFLLFKGMVIDYKQKRRNRAKVDEYRSKFAKNLKEFEEHCTPSNLVNKDFIVPHNGTAEQITATFEKILDMSFELLKKEIQKDEYNCSTVLRAFGWRALHVNRTLNCVTDVIMESFTQAANLDEVYYKKSVEKPPLLGLPFSVKSNFYIKDYDATVGLAALLGNKVEKTAPLVQFLCQQGAVPFVLTNVPQGLLSYITSNPLYGTTLNPWDFNRTPGGSSGGEAALIAAGGASFGIGNDLVGSLRIPAAFCGLVSLKPTQDRLHESHMNAGLPGRGRLGLSVGFYTKTVPDQEFLLKQVVGHPRFRDLCPQSSPAAYRTLENRQPVIGYFAEDGFSTYAPSNKRAVVETVDALKRRGYDCKPFDMNAISEQFPPLVIADMLFKNVMPDNGAYMASMYSGEYYDKFMSYFIHLVCAKQWLPQCFLPPLLWLGQFTPFRSQALRCLGGAVNKGLSGARQNQENTDEFKWKWIEYWKSLGIDALICPSFITPAQPYKSPIFLSTGVFITGLFNMLDVPAGVVPVCPVREKENDALVPNGDFVVNRLRSALKASSGLPNAVQVVTLPNEEEWCIRVMQAVEEVAEGVQHLAWKQTSMKGDASDCYFERRSEKEITNSRL